MPVTNSRLLRRVWYIFGAGCVVAATISGSVWLFHHWNEPDLQTVVVNFVVAWIPFVLAILIAFVPDLRKAHIAWRIGIVAVGLVWSILLAKQQVLSVRAARKDQQQAIMEAVDKSDEHTDQQIARVRSDVQSLTKGIGGQLSALDKDLSASISEVKPPPAKVAALRVNFWDYSSSIISMHGGADGVFTLDFTATNTSEVVANGGDMWIEVCQGCLFAEEPTGFDKPNGSAETVRHRTFGILNPGVSLAKMTIQVKPSKQFQSFEVAWRYSCGTCGKMGDPQKFTVSILPPYKIKGPALKLN